MPTTSLKISGLDKLDKQLGRLPLKVQKRVLPKVIRAGGAPMVKAAKRLVPVGTGLLKLSIAMKVKTYKRSGSIVAIIGPRTAFKSKKAIAIRQGGRRAAQANPAKYARLVEFGHVGVAARPFLRPAFNNNKRRSLRIIRAKLWTEIRKELRRVS